MSGRVLCSSSSSSSSSFFFLFLLLLFLKTLSITFLIIAFHKPSLSSIRNLQSLFLSLAHSNFFHNSPENLPGGGYGWLFLRLRRIRTQPIEASLLRQRIGSTVGSVDVTVAGGIPPDGADVLRSDIRSGEGRQSGHSELPALRARRVRSSGTDTAWASRRRHGSGVLLGHGVCNGHRKVARALRDRK